MHTNIRILVVGHYALHHMPSSSMEVLAHDLVPTGGVVPPALTEDVCMHLAASVVAVVTHAILSQPTASRRLSR